VVGIAELIIMILILKILDLIPDNFVLPMKRDKPTFEGAGGI
jgi:hypothetical protein